VLAEVMSAAAETLLEQSQKLHPMERQEILQHLLRLPAPLAASALKPFPAVELWRRSPRRVGHHHSNVGFKTGFSGELSPSPG